jgi:hypothetical protein
MRRGTAASRLAAGRSRGPAEARFRKLAGLRCPEQAGSRPADRASVLRAG